MLVQINNNDNLGYYRSPKLNSVQCLHKTGKMHGVKRVAVFCVMTMVLPTILIITPLYLRHNVFADVKYAVAESDILAMVDGISTIFCESHSLKMNGSFNAFQLRGSPELSKKRKHIRLKKSMTLPDDTLEYWGFYLLKGATVSLKVCSRYEGSRILVVRGERNLRTCGLLEHNLNKFGATMDRDHVKVNVTFETVAQEIPLEESNDTESLKNNAAEDQTGEDISEFIRKKFKNKSNKTASMESKHSKLNLDNESIEEEVVTRTRHHKRHAKSRHNSQHKKRNSDKNTRLKRDIPGQMLDTRITHGGNNLNYTKNPNSDSSASSFETGLYMCYDGQILLTQKFPPSHLCTDVTYLERGNHMQATHEVASDGYYYYIFYSDNDIEVNDVHAIFNIYKPTYQYVNISESKGCLNQSVCTFPLGFWSDETVIVEVPTRDGIEHEEDDITYLISTCHPRMTVYMIFPITVLLLIMGCAFV